MAKKIHHPDHPNPPIQKLQNSPLGSHVLIAGLRGLGSLIKALPPVMWGQLASVLTPLFWILLAKHRQRTLTNLMDTGRNRRQAYHIGMASFRSNLLVLFESLAMERIVKRRGVQVTHAISPAAAKKFKRVNSRKELMAIAVSGHVGVWELMGAEGAHLLAPATITASARNVKNPILNEYLIGLRKSYGLNHIDKEGIIRYIIQMRRKKVQQVYVFLCDQHFRRGEKLFFMNKKACTVTMPATLALKYQCPIFMGRCLRRAPGDYSLEVDLLDTAPYNNMPPEAAARSITQKINTYIEASIEAAPEQWTWAHRRWRGCCEE